MKGGAGFVMNTIIENTLLFSIIIPVYNNEKDLVRCVKSILAQSYAHFELILVDDGSTDSSSQICNQFAAEDERVRVMHREHEGVVAARNAGLFSAKGKYIYYVDGDDWIAAGLLEEASQVLTGKEPPDIFAFAYVSVGENDKYEKKSFHLKQGMYDKERLKKEIYPRLACQTGSKKQARIDLGTLWNKIIVKKLLEKHYCRNKSLFRHEDTACAYECMYFADKIYFSDSAMYFYNQLSASSNQKRYHADLLKNDYEFIQYLRIHLGELEDVGIDKLIGMLEFRCLVSVLHQEMKFHHSIRRSARFLKENLRYDQNSVIYSCDGSIISLYVCYCCK